MKPVVIRLRSRRWFKPGRTQLLGVSESRSGEFRPQRMGWDYDSAVNWLVRHGYRFLRRDGERHSGGHVVETFGLVSEYGDASSLGEYVSQDEIGRVALDYEDEFLEGVAR